MTALGRILQVIGWLWIAVGFFGPLVNIPDVSVFPGIIILFISRVVRKQGEQTQRREDPEQAQQQHTPRPLNTQRSQPPALKPSKAPEPTKPEEPERATEPRATLESRVASTERPRLRPSPDLEMAASATPKPGEDEERTEMLERVLLAGKRTTERPRAPVYPETKTEDERDRPLTSAEMIARAHRRWDRKPN